MTDSDGPDGAEELRQAWKARREGRPQDLKPGERGEQQGNSGAPPPKQLPDGVTIEDFHAYLSQHLYIFTPTRELWPQASLNAVLPKVDGLKASTWLDRNRAVHQMTWAPGEPMLIKDRLVAEGGWFNRPGITCFNLYKPPTIVPGDPNGAGPWLDHVRKIYPDDADHTIKWCAQRVQHPDCQ
jgi:hypothetical protein